MAGPHRVRATMAGRLGLAFAAAVWLGGAVAPRGSDVTLLGPGGNLQAALDRARPGDLILLQAGAVFVGNFVLPAKEGDDSRPITVRSSVGDGEGPARSTRVLPEQAHLLPKLRSPNGEPVLRTARGARHWRLVMLEIAGDAAEGGDLVRLGDGGSRDGSASDLVIDRCYIHGSPGGTQKRGIALNSGLTRIVNSWVSEIKAVGQDSQAIAGWNGPGPYTILNNRLEAAGQAVLFGGADPETPGLVPDDIWISGNHLTRPVPWRGRTWQVKNLLELKNARAVRIEGNLIEHNWGGAQPGFAVLLTPRNQEGRAPWSTVENVAFRYNVVRHVAAAVNLLGRDSPRESRQARGIEISNNLFYDVDGAAWSGNGEFLRIGDGPSNVVIEHNTIAQSGNIISVYGGDARRPMPVEGFVFRGNIARHNAYGVHGTGRGVGNDTLSAYFPGAVFTGNLLAGAPPSLYPGGNLCPPGGEFERFFVDVRTGDYHLAPGVAAPEAGGAKAGADLDEVNRAWRGAERGQSVRLRKVPPPERERKGPGRGEERTE